MKSEVNPIDYHEPAERGVISCPVSSSTLRAFRQCPHRWVKGYNSPESDAKDYGNLFDTLLLTPNQFNSRYVIEPSEYTNEDGETKPWSNNAKVCKTWNASQGKKEIIKAKDFHAARNAVEQMVCDETIESFLVQSDRQVLVGGEWLDKATGLVIPVRCLIDIVPRKDTEFSSCAGDAKSTRTANLRAWARDCYNFGYYIQGAWNLDMLAAATGEDRNTFCFILQESYAPYEVGKRMLSQGFLDLGRTEYRTMIADYCRCLKTGIWPGYDDTKDAIQGWSLVEEEPWMVEKAMLAMPAIETDEPAPADEDENFDVVP